MEKPNLLDELDWSINWVTSLEVPSRPWPSVWKSDAAWESRWRETRNRVLTALERAKWESANV